MAFRIYDEFELEQFLNKGLSPEPIVITKGTGYSITNYTFVRGEFKNTFLNANADYISLDNTYSLLSGEYIELEFDGLGFSNGVYLFGGVGAGVYIRVLPTTIQMSGNGSSVVTWGGAFNTLKQIIRLERTGDNIELFINSVSLSTQSVGDNTDFPFSVLARRDLVGSSDISLYYVDFNGVKFNLNERIGDLTVATNGDKGTRTTSHIGLNYINNTMIQPVQV